MLETVLERMRLRHPRRPENGGVEQWLNRRRQEGASARTRNIDLVRLIAFANWCATNRRLIDNPFRGMPKANEAPTLAAVAGR